MARKRVKTSRMSRNTAEAQRMERNEAKSERTRTRTRTPKEEIRKQDPTKGKKGKESETKKENGTMCDQDMIQGLKKAIGMDQRIMPVGRAFTLFANIGSTQSVASVQWKDACDYASTYQISTTPTVDMDVAGDATAANLSKELQSYALLIGQFNYESNVPAQLQNRIKLFDPTFDETTGNNGSVKADTQKRNTQQIQGLQTLREDAFLLRNTTVLSIPVVPQSQRPDAGVDVTLTCWNIVPVDYGLLTRYAYMENGISLEG